MESKLNWWDRFIGFFSPQSELKRTQARIAAEMLRHYEGASKGRRTYGVRANSTNANSETQGSLVTIRNRARDLVRNNAYAARGLQVISSNTVGRGIFTQIKVDSGQRANTVNQLARRRERDLSMSWRAWASSKMVDYDNVNNLMALQRLVIRSVCESGEILIRKRRTGRRRVMTPEGEIEVPPIQLQLLEGDYLDHNNLSSATAQNNNVIIQGVEFDQNGNRVAYHLFEEHPGNTGTGVGFSLKEKFRTVRVPASEVLHVYLMDRPGQTRGISWYAPVIIRLYDFADFEDAQRLKQKISAMYAGFIKDSTALDTMLTQTGSLSETLEPGTLEILPPGKDITFSNPPSIEGYADFAKITLRAVAMALGISAESLTGDLSGVNFSSGRMGHLEMQRNIQVWQQTLMINQFLEPIFEWWRSDMELLGNDMTRVRGVWTPPRREMIDPEKETAAQEKAIRAGLLTLSDAIRNSGADPDRHFDEIQNDNAKLDERGIILDSDPRKDANRITPAQA